jgi:hypothetical protein
VAHHNPAFFDPANTGTPAFITQDEETSGIIDAAHILGPGWFLLDVQAHKVSTDTELVEGGQLLALFIDPDIASPRGDKHKGDQGDDENDRPSRRRDAPASAGAPASRPEARARVLRRSR